MYVEKSSGCLQSKMVFVLHCLLGIMNESLDLFQTFFVDYCDYECSVGRNVHETN